MNQDPERIHDGYVPVHIFPLAAGRCAEVLTDSDGYSRCHRADHGGEGEHHVKDRAWTGRQAAAQSGYASALSAVRTVSTPMRPRPQKRAQRGPESTETGWPARHLASHLTALG